MIADPDPALVVVDAAVGGAFVGVDSFAWRREASHCDDVGSPSGISVLEGPYDCDY